MIAVEWLDWATFIAMALVAILSGFALAFRLIGRRSRSSGALVGDCSDLCMGLGMAAMSRPFGISFPVTGSIVFGALCGWSLGAAVRARRTAGVGAHATHLAGNVSMVLMSVGLAGTHSHHGGLSGSSPGIALLVIIAAAGFAAAALVTALGVGPRRPEPCEHQQTAADPAAGIGVLTGSRTESARRFLMNACMAYMLVRML